MSHFHIRVCWFTVLVTFLCVIGTLKVCDALAPQASHENTFCYDSVGDWYLPCSVVPLRADEDHA